MKRALTIVAVLALALLLVACLTPEQQNAALHTIDELRRSGAITEAQWTAMREAILAAGSANVWQQIATAVGGAALGWVTTRVQRGPVATPQEREVRKGAIRKPT